MGAQTTSVTRTFDGANRLEYAVDASGTTTYTYDANGNLTTIYPPGSDAGNPIGALSYDYDQRNLMVSHETNPDGTAWVLQAAYVYDGDHSWELEFWFTRITIRQSGIRLAG